MMINKADDNSCYSADKGIFRVNVKKRGKKNEKYRGKKLPEKGNFQDIFYCISFCTDLSDYSF